ncbi:hypothetical protein EVAR_24489_1 [Eumeta japonica]|uniref:Uncharacterized protein n=1 Tax=Eumeta variegata TaxID=151549 RepID=A0A4C1WWK7_EUMVA|nr:hypothetical protein EVAR_24489_1 [Eumeta japonica]
MSEGPWEVVVGFPRYNRFRRLRFPILWSNRPNSLPSRIVRSGPSIEHRVGSPDATQLVWTRARVPFSWIIMERKVCVAGRYERQHTKTCHGDKHYGRTLLINDSY